ncbi:MAG: hypothetical protein ACPH8A_08025, partial [Flavobacteriaceae bacterium]
TDNYQLDHFELHYYFDKKVKHTQRLIYNDNGLLANAYEKGHYELLKIDAKYNYKQIQIELSATNGVQFQSNIKDINLVLYNLDKVPNKVLFNNKKINYQYDYLTKTCQLKLTWETSNKSKIKIKF